MNNRAASFSRPPQLRSPPRSPPDCSLVGARTDPNSSPMNTPGRQKSGTRRPTPNSSHRGGRHAHAYLLLHGSVIHPGHRSRIALRMFLDGDGLGRQDLPPNSPAPRHKNGTIVQSSQFISMVQAVTASHDGITHPGIARSGAEIFTLKHKHFVLGAVQPGWVTPLPDVMRTWRGFGTPRLASRSSLSGHT